MGTAFANNLAAVRHVGRVAAISHAAALEYMGWREMLTGVGLPGPAIEPILLPVEATTPSEEALTRARAASERMASAEPSDPWSKTSSTSVTTTALPREW